MLRHVMCRSIRFFCWGRGLSGSLKTAGYCIRCATRPSDAERESDGHLSGGFGLKPSPTRLFISLRDPSSGRCEGRKPLTPLAGAEGLNL